MTTPLAVAPSGTSCLIVGCGYVGQRLARREAGRREILAVVRSAASAEALRARGVRVAQCDLDATGGADDPYLREAAAGAAIVWLAPPPEHGTTDPRLEAWLRGLGDARPSSLVYISTTGVYGDTGGRLVDETAPLAPGNDRAKRRVAAEQTATAWGAVHDVRCVVLRVPGIYGPHRLPLERLRRGEPALRPEDAGPGNRIHVDDLVECIVTAIDDTNARGAYNVTDGDHSSTTEYLRQVAEQAGLPPPELVSREEAPRRISPGMLAFLLESRRVDNRRLREELGLQLRYPTARAGIRSSLDEMHVEAAAT